MTCYQMQMDGRISMIVSRWSLMFGDGTVVQSGFAWPFF